MLTKGADNDFLMLLEYLFEEGGLTCLDDDGNRPEDGEQPLARYLRALFAGRSDEGRTHCAQLLTTYLLTQMKIDGLPWDALLIAIRHVARLRCAEEAAVDRNRPDVRFQILANRLIDQARQIEWERYLHSETWSGGRLRQIAELMTLRQKEGLCTHPADPMSDTHWINEELIKLAASGQWLQMEPVIRGLAPTGVLNSAATLYDTHAPTVDTIVSRHLIGYTDIAIEAIKRATNPGVKAMLVGLFGHRVPECEPFTVLYREAQAQNSPIAFDLNLDDLDARQDEEEYTIRCERGLSIVQEEPVQVMDKEGSSRLGATYYGPLPLVIRKRGDGKTHFIGYDDTRKLAPFHYPAVHLVELLSRGDWLDATDLVRGTAEFGAFGSELKNEPRGPIYPILLKATVAALWQAEHSWIGAALGQLILAEHQRSERDPKVPSPIRLAAEECVVEAGFPITTEYAYQLILLKISTLLQAAIVAEKPLQLNIWR